MSAKKITLIGLISCVAYLSSFFNIPISFLSYEIKDIIITLGSIYLGAFYSIVICFVVSILEMITISSSGVIGFIMNFLSSCFYILPICYFYKKGGHIIKGIIIGTITMSIGMFIFNIFMTPLYLKVPLKETLNLLFTLITPFNIIKGALNGFLIYLLYKPLLKALKKMNL